jgi:hypothetical protein
MTTLLLAKISFSHKLFFKILIMSFERFLKVGDAPLKNRGLCDANKWQNKIAWRFWISY